MLHLPSSAFRGGLHRPARRFGVDLAHPALRRRRGTQTRWRLSHSQKIRPSPRTWERCKLKVSPRGYPIVTWGLSGCLFRPDRHAVAPHVHLHPACPSVPRRAPADRRRVDSRDQARRLPHDGAPRRIRCPIAHPPTGEAVCRQERARLGTMPFVHNSNRPICDAQRDLHAQSCLEIRLGFARCNCKASLPAHSRAGRHPAVIARTSI